MAFIKSILFTMVIATSSSLGNMFSKKYINRVEELKEIKSALVMLKTKIRYTYAPIVEIFIDISKNLNGNISILFQNACKQIEILGATEGFCKAIEITNTNLLEDDKNVLKELSKLLGKTDIEGQLNEIELTETFINIQIEKAEKEKEKNAKLYKTLGVICGLGIVIILI